MVYELLQAAEVWAHLGLVLAWIEQGVVLVLGLMLGLLALVIIAVQAWPDSCVVVEILLQTSVLEEVWWEL